MEEGPQNNNYHTIKLNIYGENAFNDVCYLFNSITREFNY